MTPDALEQRADALAGAGDFAAALGSLRAAIVLAPDRLPLWIKSAAMHRATGDAAASLAALDRALALDPFDFTALLMRATTLHLLGLHERAGQAYGHALAQAPAKPPANLGPVLAAARERYRAWQEGQAATLRRAAPARSPAVDRMITNAVRLTEADREGPTHYCYPDLPEIGFHARDAFPWLEALEAAAPVIEAEFRAVTRSNAAELVPYIQYGDAVRVDRWKALNKNPDWTAIHLIERGQVVEANARHCPKTMALLGSFPQPVMPGAGPNAMFSLLAPHTHIPPHTGIANTRLVCHLPLIVPDGCWFRVDQETRAWTRGEAFVFDDTVEHEAMNPSDALRVVFIFDVWHPDISEADRKSIAAVIGAGGQVHGL